MDASATMKVMVLVIFALMFAGHGSAELAFPADLQNRTARQMSCLENHEYPHNSFCCKNCEAGTYVKEKCSRNQEKGTCAPCERGTYAEHPTGMEQCLQCSQCHRDQIMVTECTSTSNTKCECKPSTFCLPDEPCEVCKKCTKCKFEEEEVVSPCTATSNTKCRRRPTSPTEGPTDKPSESNKTNPIAIVIPILLILIICIVCIGAFLWKKRKRRQSDTDAALKEVKVPIDNIPKSEEEQENSRNAGLEEEEHRPESRPLLTQETQETGSKSIPVEDEDRGLGDSLPNTTSSSQTSLSALPSPRPSPPVPRQVERDTDSWAREDGPPRKLVPLLGEEESLSKSFDLFDALDVRYHNKFFRSIGVSDNSIKVAETQQPMDKVYDLLRVWMQKEGLRANINTLLQALLDLDQRYSAEHIASKAVERGYYKYE